MRHPQISLPICTGLLWTGPACSTSPNELEVCMLTVAVHSAATNNQTGEGVAIKKVTNVFSKKILAKRALREIKLLQHFRGHRNVSDLISYWQRLSRISRKVKRSTIRISALTERDRSPVCMIWTYLDLTISMRPTCMRVITQSVY